MQQSDQHNTDVVETHSAAVLNVTEACAELRVSRWTLYELIRSRKLSTIKIGRRRLIPREAVSTLVDQLRAEGAT